MPQNHMDTQLPPLTPVLFASHGSPVMAYRESDSANAWIKFGDEARVANIKGVVFVGAHWEETYNKIRVATKENPDVVQMDIVPRSRLEGYPIHVSTLLAEKVVGVLKDGGFNDVEADPKFDWHDDLMIPSLWMFPRELGGTPPSTVVSLNARYDAAFHINLGRALAPLRSQGILIVCTGGAVHNLYRNNWVPMIKSGFTNNFQEGSTPAKWASDFAQSVGDVVANSKTKGSKLAGALTRLTKSPQYRQAHPTDDHYYPLLVASGLVMHSDEQGKWLARTWELTNMCNDQFMWGNW